jgi:ribulose kinase
VIETNCSYHSAYKLNLLIVCACVCRYVTLEHKIQLAMSECIPRSPKKKQLRNCWFTKELVKLLWKKNSAFKKWKKTGQCNHRAQYKKLVKKMKKEMFESKRQTFLNAFKDCKDSATFWRELNKFSGKVQREQIHP